MYPKTEDELRGWTLNAFGVGAAHNVVHADSSVIAWGSGVQSGELGLGEKKSSANPAKVEALEGVGVCQVACGLAHTVLLVEAGTAVDALPEFVPTMAEGEPTGAEEEAEEGSAAPKKGKGKAAAKRAAEPAAAPKAGGGKKAKKASES